jgi:hypothetical protein
MQPNPVSGSRGRRTVGRERESFADRHWKIATAAFAVAALLALVVWMSAREKHESPQEIWCEKPVPLSPVVGAGFAKDPVPRASPDGVDLGFADRCVWGSDDKQQTLMVVLGASRHSFAARFVGTNSDAIYVLTGDSRDLGGDTWVRLRRQ